MPTIDIKEEEILSAFEKGQLKSVATKSELAKFKAVFWCPGEDSNLHGVTHWYLKPARLPIPPPGHGGSLTGRA